MSRNAMDACEKDYNEAIEQREQAAMERKAMSEQHTPEPWSTAYRVRPIGMYAQEVFDASGQTIATMAWHSVKLDSRTTTTDREANARRIVACVNACAGIPTYQLTKENNIPTDLGEMINFLRGQRDELLAALGRVLLCDIAEVRTIPESCGAIHAARAAIENTKEQKA